MGIAEDIMGMAQDWMDDVAEAGGGVAPDIPTGTGPMSISLDEEIYRRQIQYHNR